MATRIKKKKIIKAMRQSIYKACPPWKVLHKDEKEMWLNIVDAGIIAVLEEIKRVYYPKRKPLK